jgi:hypothetical protein
MSIIVWILLGLGLGLITSKVVSTTGEGTVVERHCRGHRRDHSSGALSRLFPPPNAMISADWFDRPDVCRAVDPNQRVAWHLNYRQSKLP